mmetsp:Transcript_3982/g.13160  ORF Transcript_3982/g.13160 Transcript_3982/m.13160 type:complete len:294 (+) Transcript_3982:668-1549(+)
MPASCIRAHTSNACCRGSTLDGPPPARSPPTDGDGPSVEPSASAGCVATASSAEVKTRSSHTASSGATKPAARLRTLSAPSARPPAVAASAPRRSHPSSAPPCFSVGRDSARVARPGTRGGGGAGAQRSRILKAAEASAARAAAFIALAQLYPSGSSPRLSIRSTRRSAAATSQPSAASSMAALCACRDGGSPRSSIWSSRDKADTQGGGAAGGATAGVRVEAAAASGVEPEMSAPRVARAAIAWADEAIAPSSRDRPAAGWPGAARRPTAVKAASAASAASTSAPAVWASTA